jgi:hypothetical protein
MNSELISKTSINFKVLSGIGSRKNKREETGHKN